MLESYLTGIGSIVLMVALWLAVQTAWSRVFAGHVDDPDPLAGRSCEGCGCGLICRRRGAALTQENHQ